MMTLKMMNGKVMKSDLVRLNKQTIIVTKILSKIEFCSSSSVDENEDTKTPAQVVQPVIEESKPAIAINLFADLDPRAMFRRI